ncbi:hypothetical protein COU62_00015 [Candidatus Pacearchaeota archaeon CG10_big_fil_rev_8_21_14_0_10_35_219]|nr:TatD family hydrolase [Candidatus Pacearchaeota archaeon]OIO43365.1 MAG: hypothetical protein AUJ63_00540 [Candidatus Pacearchaeota archaeon CG1_02_35_32]PIO08526.1 MAG: hypothetical protein COU62_00015 [Candidatus Pacearchaeota archaeon CG10_big_fil_rev_8_21_14_0_10_35_219]PIY81517.1 MAG: hypothetical protein COY79_02130 [Candidatus Pacearchaeota archaeon CG_4_10_14_0_8_um_filter_35_169]PIZ80397.1 MAG: hypothetical protein COY00_00985 [Candidatus Pacearchaeota archaeon CG_4_10_14_0_2_um_fil
MFIDVHCHLDLLEKEIKLKKAVERARKKNIIIVSDGIDSETNKKMLEYFEEYGVKICLGVYPDEPGNIDEEIEFIRKNSEKVWGIGEVGMDFVKGKSKKQETVFKKFISLSKELDKPITVHSRKAERECIEILEKAEAKKVIMHYFSGNLKLVSRIIDNGWFLSIPTAVKRSEHFQNVARIVPIEQLLCETDSPYSHPDKKFPNEPVNVLESYQMIAKMKGLNLKYVEKRIEENFLKLSK